MPVPTKTCAKCKRTLELIHFSVLKKSKDGLNTYCRECFNHMNRKHYIRKTRSNPDFGKKKTEEAKLRFGLGFSSYNRIK